MKLSLFVLAGAGIIALGFAAKNKSIDKRKESVYVSGSFAPVTVLELFTSEGCSSCPPGDKLLPELIKLDSNIIALSFHVDYWNRLGWEDPFSSAAFSERQRDYARQLHLESVYTPQLIVNGEYELVGSSRSKAESTIKMALKEKAQVKLTIDNVKMTNGKINFIVHSDGDFKKTDILAAVVQKQVTTNVKAGENSGAKLSHTNVVSTFSRQTAADKNEFELELTESISKNNWQLIIYAQQKNNLKITGAVLYNQAYTN